MALSVDGKVRILNEATVAGATGAGTSTDMIEGGIMAVEANGKTSSGTGAAIIEIQVSNNNSTWQTAGTINLNLGPTQTSSRFEMDASWMGWLYVRAKLTSISGTGASVSAYKTAGVGDVLTSERDVDTTAPSTVTSYLFVHPTTLATSRQVGERQIYVPLDDGFYYGMFIGTKVAAQMVPSISDICIAKPGLHKWHGACTKVGTWTTSPAGVSTGAFQDTGNSYSVTAGDTISVSVTGSIVAIRSFNTTNGGFGVVSIDGDFTRATRLPAFTADDYAGGFCRASDVGKRYICGFSSAPQSECAVIADDLSFGAHTILVEATGTKPTASSAARCQVEGIASVNGGNIGTADVHMIPVNYVLHETGITAQCYVPHWAPVGSSDYQFMGENHSDNSAQSKETTTSLTVYVNEVDQTALATGTYASGTMITIRHISTLAHKADLVTPVATKSRVYTFGSGRKHPAMCDITITWSSDGILNLEYPVMMTVGEMITNPAATFHSSQFHTAEIAGNVVPLGSANNDTVTYYRGAGSRLFCYGDRLIAWAALESGVPGKHLFSNYAGSYQDRTSKDEKLYIISSNGPQFVPNGEVRRFLIGWGAHRI